MTWKRLRNRITAVTIAANVFGAAVLYTYFALVEPGYTLEETAGSSQFIDSLVFCIVVTALEIVLFMAVVDRLYRFVPKDVESFVETASTDQLRMVAGRLLSVPANIAVLCLVAWLVSGVIFTHAPPAFRILHDQDYASAQRLLVGMYFVAAPTTIALVFFLLEWVVRDAIVRLLPARALTSTPSSWRIYVLPKMFLVAFMIGAVPITVMSFITLEGIGKVAENPENFPHFANQMRVTLVFLFVLALSTVAVMSWLVSRSVSDPIRSLGAAMSKMASGETDTKATVITNDEIGTLGAGFNRMVEGLKERDMIRETFGLYVSKEVATEILRSRETAAPAGELRDITILVADIRGFTRMTDTLAPSTALTVLNRFFEVMTEIIIRHEGTIDEFTGDGILVFFGAPVRLSDHTRNAVACAPGYVGGPRRIESTKPRRRSSRDRNGSRNQLR